MDEILELILFISQEIKEIKNQIEILNKRPDVLFREEWMDGQDVMLILHICQRTLRTLRESGKLSYSRINNKLYYKTLDIKALLEENYIRYHLPQKR